MMDLKLGTGKKVAEYSGKGGRTLSQIHSYPPIQNLPNSPDIRINV